jgi:membrane protease YdiL (CAAX protease family)
VSGSTQTAGEDAGRAKTAWLAPSIAAPGRSSTRDAVLIVASTVAHAAFVVASDGTRGYPRGWPFAVVCVALPVLAWRFAGPYAVHAALCLGLLPAWYLGGGRLIWPLYFAVPLVTYAVIVRSSPRLRGSVGWLARGQIDRRTAGSMVVAMVIPAIALTGWFFLVHPNVEGELAQIPSMSVPLLALGGLVFAAGNALMEEFIWRGVLMEALDSAFGPGSLSIVLQGASFGVAHYGGFPRGALGVSMATVYGIMIGVIRRRSRGLMAPFVTHIVADVVIFVLILTVIRH